MTANTIHGLDAATRLAYDIADRFGTARSTYGITDHVAVDVDTTISDHRFSLWVTVRPGKTTTVTLYTAMSSGFQTVLDLRSESMSPDTVEKLVRIAAADHITATTTADAGVTV